MTFYEIDKIILGKIGISPDVFADMTIVEVTAAVCGYSEKEYDLFYFFKRNIWDACRESVFKLLKPQYKNLKNSRQIWKFEWDEDEKEDMSKVEERLKKADKIFPKYFPENLK